jgi:hypothetical protein
VSFGGEEDIVLTVVAEKPLVEGSQDVLALVEIHRQLGFIGALVEKGSDELVIFG